MVPAFVCLFFVRSLCRKGTCCLLLQRQNKKTRSLGPVNRASLSRLLQDSVSSSKLRHRGKLYLWLAQLLTLLEFARNGFCFICIFLRCLCMRVGHDSGTECRTLHMLSKCPAAKLHPHSPMRFHFKAVSLFSELTAESAGL